MLEARVPRHSETILVKFSWEDVFQIQLRWCISKLIEALQKNILR